MNCPGHISIAGNRRKIRAISFDLDDTLWDSKPTLLCACKAFFEFLERNFPRIPAIFSPSDFFGRMKVLHMTDPACKDFTVCRKKALEMVAREAGYDPVSVVEPAFDAFLVARQRVQLYDGVLHLLRRLRREGYLLLAVSNGNADIRQIQCLRPLFDVTVSPLTCHASKPSPLPFLEACRLANVQPCEVVHVGDDYVADMVGAKNAGLSTVWVRTTPGGPEAVHKNADIIPPGCEIYDDGSAADAIIHETIELEGVLTNWGALSSEWCLRGPMREALSPLPCV